MNRYTNSLYDNYYTRRLEAKRQLEISKPDWYLELKKLFDNCTNYEEKKKHEVNLTKAVNEYLDKTV